MSFIRYSLGFAVSCAALVCARPALAQFIESFEPVPLPPALTIEKVNADRSPAPAVHATLAPTQQYSHGDPSADAQYILELINRARANPSDEGARLATTTDSDVRMAYQYFSVDTAAVRAQFASYASKPPLAFHAMLVQAAAGHAADMRANNFQGHTGSNGSTFDQRLNSQGYTGWVRAGENVSGYSRSLWYAHAGFNVDWGVADLGHRKNIMDFEEAKPDFVEVGIAVEDVGFQPPQGTVGRFIVVEDFGVRGTMRYIVGVVYSDANSNAFYDPGEGISGVTVMPDAGTYYAITSTSGGYAIPITTSGLLSVTFSGPQFGSGVTRQISTGSESLKLDVTPVVLPAAPQLISPANGATVPVSNVAFTWSVPSQDVIRYGIEIGRDSAMLSRVVDDTTLVPPGYTAISLPANQRLYWRVRAANVAGWGAYSETRMVEASTSSVDMQMEPRSMALSVIPNPAREVATVRVSLAHAEPISMTVFDAAGRAVAERNLLGSDISTGAITLDVSRLATGAYTVECRTRSGVARTPMIVTR